MPTPADCVPICLTILDQLTHAPRGQGIGRIRAMLGATGITFTWLNNGDNLVEFAFKMCRTWNRCYITLTARDTYTMRFARVKRDGTYARADLVLEDVSADCLSRLFTEHTGLDTHL